MKTRKNLLCAVVAALLSVQVAAATPFTDVRGDQWFAESVNYCREKGFVGGYNDGSFKPNNNITRAEFCVMLNQLAKNLSLKKTASGTAARGQYASQYTDYKQDRWYSEAVADCLANGFISGTSSNTLSLDNNILRQDVAVMVDKMFGWKFEPNTHQGGLCNDEYSSDGQRRYWWIPMYRFIDLGIYRGNANWDWSKGSAYKNNYPITRAEMCAVFKFILENQNWIDARANRYDKIDMDADDYFLKKEDQVAFEKWKKDNADYKNGNYTRALESISKKVAIDTVTIKELNFDGGTSSGNNRSTMLTAQEAYEIACDYWSYHEGDVDPDLGYEIAVFQDGLITYNGTQVYQFRARWLVNNNHWSTLEMLYVDAFTGECIQPGK